MIINHITNGPANALKIVPAFEGVWVMDTTALHFDMFLQIRSIGVWLNCR
jgi:hypothetical protein